MLDGKHGKTVVGCTNTDMSCLLREKVNDYNVGGVVAGALYVTSMGVDVSTVQ